MSGSDRKPVVVALCCAAAAVLFFATGAFGPVLGDADASGEEWQERLGDLRIGAPVTAGDLLAIGSSCAVDRGTISWSGSCLLQIEEFGGRFSFRTTKNFTARVVDGPVVAQLNVRDTAVEQAVETGETVEFTVGRSGGLLGLQCPGIDGCALALE